MKTRSFLALAALAIGGAIALGGCAQQPIIGGSHRASSRPPRTFALAVTLPDGGQLTPAQWAAVKTAFEQQLAAAGCSLTDNISLADKIIRVVFTPTEEDPSNGNAMVLSVRDNPAYAFNTPTTIMPVSYSGMGFGYSSLLPSSYYYGYDDYSYGGTTVTPRIDPPNHNRPTQPVDCPPGQEHRSHPGSDHFAGSPGNTGSNGSWNRSDSSHGWTGSSDGSGRTWTPSSDGSTRTWTRTSDGTTQTWTRNDSGHTWTRSGDNSNSSNSSGRTWTRSDPYPTSGNSGGNSSSGHTWTRSEPTYSSSSNSGSGSSWSGSSSSSSGGSSFSSSSSSDSSFSSSSSSGSSSSSSSVPSSTSSAATSNQAER